MKVLITVDVEAHRVIDEISSNNKDSLGDILSALNSFGICATFFVDICEVSTWGEDFIRDTCQRILAEGHNVQLHIHPHHYTKDHERWQLSEYTRSEQKEIIAHSIMEFHKVMKSMPIAFRAGGFGVNRDTLDILRENGIKMDCSHMQDWKGSNLEIDLPGMPCMVNGILEIPMTPAIMLGTRRKPIRTAPVDFNWLPLFVIKRIIRRLKRRGSPFVVLLIHSSSMFIRVGSERLVYRRGNLRKLNALLFFVKEEELEVVTVDHLLSENSWSNHEYDENIYIEKNPFVQYWTLLFQSFIGAGIKWRFALFLGLHIIPLFCLLIYLAMNSLM